MGNTLELGETYNFAGYQWVPVRIDEKNQVAVMQSLGVTAGPWAGYAMPQFGNGDYYKKDISGEDISDYDEKTRALMEQIKPVISGDAGLYLPSYDDIKDDSVWRVFLAKVAGNYRLFDTFYNNAWIGTCKGCYNAFNVLSGSGINFNGQSNYFVVPAAFNLDLSKIEVKRSRIVIKKYE